MQFTRDSFLQDIKSRDKDEQLRVFSSSGDTSLLLKVNNCNGAYFRQTKQEPFVFSAEYSMFPENDLSLAFSFVFCFAHFFPHFSH